MNFDPFDNKNNREASPDTRSELRSTAEVLLMSDMAIREQLSMNDGLFDENGEPITSYSLTLTAETDNAAIRAALQELDLDDIEITYMPLNFNEIEERTPDCIWIGLTGDNELTKGRPYDSRLYSMVYDRDKGDSEVVIETEDDLFMCTRIDPATGELIPLLSEWNPDAQHLLVPANRPITQQEADRLQQILEAVGKVVS